jgi:hypothetical protein
VHRGQEQRGLIAGQGDNRQQADIVAGGQVAIWRAFEVNAVDQVTVMAPIAAK